MLLGSLFALSLSLTSVFTSPTPSHHDAFENIEARASTVAVTGAPGGVQPRLEIRTMLNQKPDQWNLYILAMAAFQAVNQSDPLSYYQLAGIHGVPNIPWDGVQANPKSSGAVGYCTHSSILFPTWHRTYLALIEQVFYNQVQTIVSQFPAGSQRDKYATAAKTIRMPYWDWAAAPPTGLPTFPYVVSNKYVTVTAPSGSITIINPLFRYGFHPLNGPDMLYNPWAIWPVTFRYPTNNYSISAVSQNNLAQDAVENNRISLRNSIYNLFTACSAYPEFSNDASASSTPGCSNSLESIHDSIHALTGGSNDGHMTWLWWAAFDPVFWLHHANVDRLFAMWQAIYPNTYVVNQVATGSTFTIAQGSTQGAGSKLTPFHSDTKGTFHTSNSVRDWTTFGYTYPEFVASDGSAASIKKYVNNLYGPSATSTAGSVRRTAMPDAPPAIQHRAVPAMEDRATPADLVEREIPTSQALPFVAPALLSTAAGQRYEYTANIAVNRFGLDGSFVVYIFFGQFSDDASTWAFEPALVGSYGIFAMKGMRHHNISVSGAVPLTQALTTQISAGNLANMSHEAVVPFLQSQMQWRIATTNLVAVPASEVPGLQVSVVTANATLPTSDDEFPVYTKFVKLPGVTHGRAGGFSKGRVDAFEAARVRVYQKFGRPKTGEDDAE